RTPTRSLLLPACRTSPPSETLSRHRRRPRALLLTHDAAAARRSSHSDDRLRLHRGSILLEEAAGTTPSAPKKTRRRMGGRREDRRDRCRRPRPVDLMDLNAGLYGSHSPPTARAEAHALGSHYAGSWEVTVQPSAPDPVCRQGSSFLAAAAFRQGHVASTQMRRSGVMDGNMMQPS
ncbi:unnamed protein product, partial [Urochloa humidicola]